MFELVRMFFREKIFIHDEDRGISKVCLEKRLIICIKDDTITKWKVPMTGW